MKQLILILTLLATAQAQKLEFEVASIKLGDPSVYSSLQINGDGTVTSKSTSLRTLIEQAFDLLPFQLTGGPRWIDSERFSLQAKAAGPATKAQLRLMLQTLLAERFALQLKREVKEQNVFVLQQKDRAKVKAKFVASPDGRMGLSSRTSPTGDVLIGMKGYTTEMLARALSKELEKVVVDETGLAGAFDFTFPTTHQAEQPNPFITPWAPSMGELGLRLESRKGPVEYFYAERAQLPTEN